LHFGFLRTYSYIGVNYKGDTTVLVKDVYDNFKKSAEQPLRLRSEIVIGRDGYVTPRRHHLGYKALNSHRMALKDGILCIPYRKGIRSAFIATMFNLGVNGTHSLEKVVSFLRNVASSETFMNNKGYTALEVLFARSGQMNNEQLGEKIIDEACELQRLTSMHPYGLKLAQIGFSIDIFKHDNSGIFIKLNGGIKKEIVSINQIRKSYKKNGNPIIPNITDYNIAEVTEWTIEKASKIYPFEEVNMQY
tara:strand:+ start:4596 stop:5339 length:744 start_codon:yes stop_codon:yes gene_type:complete